MKLINRSGVLTCVFLATTLSSCSLVNVAQPGKIKETLESMVRFRSELPKTYSYTYAGSLTDANSPYAVIDNKSKNLQFSVMSINAYDATTSSKSLPAKLAGFLEAKVTKKEVRIVGGSKVLVKHIALSEDSNNPGTLITVMLTKPSKHTDFIMINPIDSTQPYDQKAENEILSQIATFQ